MAAARSHWNELDAARPRRWTLTSYPKRVDAWVTCPACEGRGYDPVDPEDDPPCRGCDGMGIVPAEDLA